MKRTSRNILFSILAIVFFVSACRKENEDKNDVKKVDLTSIPYNPVNHEIQTPPEFPRMPVPMDNPTTVAGLELGRFLFYDPILSIDSTISCASCHRQELAFTDGGAVSTGVFGRMGKRSSMSLANIGYASNGLFWDGRVKSLEEQALHPIEDMLEMAEKWPNVEKKLKNSQFYQEHFRKAFGIKSNLEINKNLTAKALAQFQRTLISYNSKFDRFLRRETFLSDDEMDGYLMFIDESMSVLKDAECGHCHIVNLMAGEQYFHNGLVSEEEMASNPGRYEVTKNPADKGKFRSPTLRNIMVTAPYMHDGRLATLEDVMEHYRSGGHKTFNRDLLIEDLASVQLSNADIQKIIKFLGTLTDSTFLTNPAFADPFDR